MRFELALVFQLVAAAVDAAPLYIQNPSEPVHGITQVRLVEQWRAGGAADEANLLGQAIWAESDAKGLVYVLDYQLSQVQVYDKTGSNICTLFGEGEGPGEIREPRDIVLFPSGLVGAVQEFPGKITIVDIRGNPAGTVIPSIEGAASANLIALSAAESRGGTTVIGGVAIVPGDQRGVQRRDMFLGIVNEEGRIQSRLLEQSTVWDFNRLEFDESTSMPSFWWAYAVGPDGRVYAAPSRDDYRINVYSVNGTLEMVIERKYEPWERTDREREWLTALFSGAFGSMPLKLDIKICAREPSISWLNRALLVRSSGEVWVLPSRGIREQPKQVLATFDVFTPNGRFDRQVQLICPDADASKDGIFLIGEDRVLVIRGYIDAIASMFGSKWKSDDSADGAQQMELICYGFAK